MAARLLDGRRESKKILAGLRRVIRARRLRPHLATIQVGRRPDATLYLRLKANAAATVGIRTEQHRLPATITQAALIRQIKKLNARKSITGILLQLPLPRRLDTDAVVAAIMPEKDVDGFTAAATVVPPPVAAVLHLLSLSRPKKISRVVIIGKDSVFTRRLAKQLRSHQVAIISPTRLDAPVVREADVIITAIGQGPRLRGQHVQPGVILIDVGIRKIGKKTVGDVEPSAQRKSKAFSPVPGGVGPLTVAFVLKNTVDLAT